MSTGFAGLRLVVPDAAPPPVDGPGPFSLADRERTARMLAGAGFDEISIEPVDLPVCLGAEVPSAVRLATATGPVGRALPALAEETRAVVRETIGGALGPHLGPAGVLLPGAAWIVLARR